MNDRWRSFQFFMFGFAVTFYTSFAAQMLWNWFATSALHVEPISYWQMYGLVLIWNLFAGLYASEEVRDQQKWSRVFTTLDALVPDQARKQLALLLSAEQLDEWRQSLGISAAKAFFASFYLALGWIVHSFLV